jgi:flavin-dependent dehydrogenase
LVAGTKPKSNGNIMPRGKTRDCREGPAERRRHHKRRQYLDLIFSTNKEDEASMTRISDERPKPALKTDVLVVGGGAAGLAAACTAVRVGARTLLLEKYGFCGGAAVAGLSGTVCGLFAATDNRAAAPERVVYGFADRFLDLMKSRGGVTDPVRYGKTFTLTHDPLVWREAGDHLLAEAGVKVLFHSIAVDVLNDGEHVEGVVAWTKQGRLDIEETITIDASGDADVDSSRLLGANSGHSPTTW